MLDIVDAALGGRAYLAGASFTLADVSTMPVIGMLFVTGEGELLASRPRVAGWWERVSARPSWKHVTAGA